MTRPSQTRHDTHVATQPSFAATFPGIVTAGLFALICLVWLAAGDRLPGGRWLVVHIFTLGVMTILIRTFSAHFATRATNATAPHATAKHWVATLLLAAGVTLMLTGRASALHLPLVAGSTIIMLIVGANIVILRRQRRRMTAEHTGRVIQQYEHAHIAFLIATAFGGALGAGVLPGALILGAREAHIHLMVLGWGGLTILATLTIYGPSLLGEPSNSNDTGQTTSGLQVATLGLGVATAGLLLTSLARAILPDEGAGPAMLMTVAGLAAYGYGIIAVARPLLNATTHAGRSPARISVTAALMWFVIAIVLDITTVLTGLPGWPHGLATLLLIGVLAQLALAVVSHVAPKRTGNTPPVTLRRHVVTERTNLAGVWLLNIGIGLLAAGQATRRLTDLSMVIPMRIGWALIGLVVLPHLGLLFRLRRPPTTTPRPSRQTMSPQR